VVDTVTDGQPHGGDSPKILQSIMDEIKAFVSTWEEKLARDPGECRRMEWAAPQLCTHIAELVIGSGSGESSGGRGGAAGRYGASTRPCPLAPTRAAERAAA